MKNKLLIIMIFFLGINNFESLNAQNVLDGVYVKEHVPTRRMIPYAPLREADVMWSYRIWRTIDLNEKMNLPLKYPKTKSMKDRRNLIDVIMDAVLEGSLTAYSKNDDEFTLTMTKAEVESIGAKADSQEVQDPNPPYLWRKVLVKTELNRDDVYKFRIKEDWFFDKQRSVMEVRIIGIAPVLEDKDEQGNVRGDKVLFWIYFPEARKVFANAEVFNRFNDGERRTFDDIFFKRMFSSYIIKESNVYDRRISDYKQGLDALLEAERIKNDIFNLEHDLWEY